MKYDLERLREEFEEVKELPNINLREFQKHRTDGTYPFGIYIRKIDEITGAIRCLETEIYSGSTENEKNRLPEEFYYDSLGNPLFSEDDPQFGQACILFCMALGILPRGDISKLIWATRYQFDKFVKEKTNGELVALIKN